MRCGLNNGNDVEVPWRRGTLASRHLVVEAPCCRGTLLSRHPGVELKRSGDFLVLLEVRCHAVNERERMQAVAEMTNAYVATLSTSAPSSSSDLTSPSMISEQTAAKPGKNNRSADKSWSRNI